MRAFRNILVILLGGGVAYFFVRSRTDRLRELAQSVEISKRPLTLHREPVIDITEHEPEPVMSAVAEQEPEVETDAEPEPEAEPVPVMSVVAEPKPEREPEAEPEPESEPEPQEAEVGDSDSAVPSWVQPTQGECPLSHPIKARFATGRYHEPGTKSYDKVVADCCYPNVKDAEKDGFSRSRW